MKTMQSHLAMAKKNPHCVSKFNVIAFKIEFGVLTN